MANLERLKELNCENDFSGSSIKLCRLFSRLSSERDPKLLCQRSTFSSLESVRFELDKGLSEGDSCMKGKSNCWSCQVFTLFHNPPFPISLYMLYSDHLVATCLPQAYEEIVDKASLVASSPLLSKLATLLDFREAKCGFLCNADKQANERSDVRSLACLTEILRRDDLRAKDTFNSYKVAAKLRKIMRETGILVGDSVPSRIVEERFISDVVRPCEKFSSSSGQLASMDDMFGAIFRFKGDYFAKIPQDSPFFHSLRVAMVCRRIASASDELSKKVTSSLRRLGPLLKS